MRNFDRFVEKLKKDLLKKQQKNKKSSKTTKNSKVKKIKAVLDKANKNYSSNSDFNLET